MTSRIRQDPLIPSEWSRTNLFSVVLVLILFQYIFFFENYQYPNGIYGNFQLTNVIWNTIISLYFFEENFAFSLFLHAWSNLNITRTFQVGKKKRTDVVIPDLIHKCKVSYDIRCTVMPAIILPTTHCTWSLKLDLILIYLFYLWLCWVFVAARGLSLVVASGGYSSLRFTGFSLRWLLLLRSTGSRCTGFSSYGSRGLECRLSSCGAWA